MSRTVTVLFVLVVLLGARVALAQGVIPAAGPSRNVHVNTTPPGVRAAAAGQYVPIRTPHTFQIPAGAMSSITFGAAGFQRLTVPIPIGSHDLHLNVRMSRPVFQAGIALTVIGGALTLAGVGFLIGGGVSAAQERDEWDPATSSYSTADEYCENEGEDNVPPCWDDFYFNFGVGFTGLGAPLLISGILMLALDRRRNPTYEWGTGAATP